MKKPFIFAISLMLAVCLAAGASACSLFYFGGDYTDDGANLFLRVEDGNLNDENKLYLVSPAGKHKAGEVYPCPDGFSWTFTHDSYGYVSRRDVLSEEEQKELQGFQLCEEAGTNEHGFTLTATQSLDANARIQAVDPPYRERGRRTGTGDHPAFRMRHGPGSGHAAEGNH